MDPCLITLDLVIKWSPPPPSQPGGCYRRGPSLPARAFAQGSSQRIVFLCVFVSAVLPARALSFSSRTFVFAARALVVFLFECGLSSVGARFGNAKFNFTSAGADRRFLVFSQIVTLPAPALMLGLGSAVLPEFRAH